MGKIDSNTLSSADECGLRDVINNNLGKSARHKRSGHIAHVIAADWDGLRNATSTVLP
jgi:hypothetical protein